MKGAKHIWIVNYYTNPPEFVSNARHLEFAHYLQLQGYKVTIFAAGTIGQKLYVKDYLGKQYKQVQYGEYNFVHIKVNPYVGNGLRRMYSIYQFAQRILKLRNEFEKPDIILHNMHAPFDYDICKCAKKMRCRYIAEQWDLWPDDFVTYGLVSAKNPIMKWAYYKERKMYYFASDVIFSFAGGLDYLRNKGLTNQVGGKIKEDRVHYINNGLNLDEYLINKDKCVVNDEDLHNENLFKIVYLGSIKLVNDVKQLIDALALLKSYKEIKLLIYGDGNQRDYLQQYCKENHIENVAFKEKRIPLSHCAYVLSHSDLNILNYENGFGNYGISAGKQMQSLGAGKPMICNIPILYDDVINDNKLGVCELLDTPQKYAKAILSIYNMPKEDYIAMGKRVKEVAKRFDYKVLSENLIKVIEFDK